MALKLSKIDNLSLSDHPCITADDRCFFFGEYTPDVGYKGSKTNDLILNSRNHRTEGVRPSGSIKKKQ